MSDDEQANRFLNGIKDEVLGTNPNPNPKEETLEGWLKQEDKLERLQEQFIQEHTQDFLDMLKTQQHNTTEENDNTNLKNVFCEAHKEEFQAFCEKKFNNRYGEEK